MLCLNISVMIVERFGKKKSKRVKDPRLVSYFFFLLCWQDPEHNLFHLSLLNYACSTMISCYSIMTHYASVFLFA